MRITKMHDNKHNDDSTSRAYKHFQLYNVAQTLWGINSVPNMSYYRREMRYIRGAYDRLTIEMVIYWVEDDDYGHYKCYSKTTLGQGVVDVELYGKINWSFFFFALWVHVGDHLYEYTHQSWRVCLDLLAQGAYYTHHTGVLRAWTEIQTHRVGFSDQDNMFKYVWKWYKIHPKTDIRVYFYKASCWKGVFCKRNKIIIQELWFTMLAGSYPITILVMTTVSYNFLL